MTTKKKPANKPDVVKVLRTDEESHDDAIARIITNPKMLAAVTLREVNNTEIDINSMIDALSSQIDKVNNGDMKRPEAMLLMQAHTLDGLFNTLARKAHVQSHMPHYESFLRLALKAQGQCRATLETLSNIKNPPVIYAKQANIATNQQINNTSTPAPHAEKIKNQPNELLEVQHGSTALDTGTTGAAIENDKAMAALE
jgi:hypothetical protein